MESCAYGQVNRQMIVDLKETIDANFKDIKENQNKLFNHMSGRLPVWVTILFTLLTGLVVGLVVKVLA